MPRRYEICFGLCFGRVLCTTKQVTSMDNLAGMYNDIQQVA